MSTKLKTFPAAASSSDDLLRPRDAARMLGVTYGTLKKWAFRHQIAHVKVGKLTRFTRAQLDAFIAARTVEADR